MGFTLPHTVAGGAVRSYRTLSPLPTEVGGLLSAALSVASPRLAVNEHAAVGVRTFLPHPKMAATVLASSVRDDITGRFKPRGYCLHNSFAMIARILDENLIGGPARS